jgi:hypothetical protein
MSDPRILIIESTTKTKPLCENFSDTSIVHCRNSIILKNYLQADLLDGEYKLDEILSKNYDVIICCYASPYMPHIPYRKVIDQNPNARLIWLVNDHDLEDNQLLRYAIVEKARSYDMICNNPRDGYRQWILRKNIAEKKLNDFINNWHTCNLNSLIYRDTFVDDRDKNGFIYYGTYRKHRAEDFKVYLQHAMTLSSSVKHWKKYEALGCNAEMIRPLKWQINNEDLRSYKYSLYLEDKHTHENYAFMANRFYEALMCGVVTLFAPNTSDTVSKSGYDLDASCILPKDLYGKDLMDYIQALDYQKLLTNQQSICPLVCNERKQVLISIKDFICSPNISTKH